MNYLTNYYKNLCEDLQEKINYLENLLNESHPKTRADRRRQAAKPSNDVREKIRQIEKTMGVLSKEGQSELSKITDNFSKWPGDGKVKRIFHNQGVKKSQKPKPSDRRREADSEDAMKMEETIINFLENILNEATYKKAMRAAHKDPGLLARAVDSQQRRLVDRQGERTEKLQPKAADGLHIPGFYGQTTHVSDLMDLDTKRKFHERQASYKYGDGALGKPDAGSLEANKHWERSRKLTTILGDRGPERRYAIKLPSNPDQSIEDIMGNLKNLSTSSHHGNVKKRREQRRNKKRK